MTEQATPYVYEIIIKNDTSGNASPNATAGAPAKPDPKDTKDELDSVKGIALAKIAENIAYSDISYMASTISLRTGQSEYQQKMQLLADAGKKVFDIGVAAATGALFAGGIGAVVGAASSLAMQAISIGQAQRTINMQSGLESISIREANIRAGAGGNRIGKIDY